MIVTESHSDREIGRQNGTEKGRQRDTKMEMEKKDIKKTEK